MKNKKKFHSSLGLSFIIFTCYIFASVITAFIAFILTKLNVNIGAFGPLALVICVLLSCTLLATVITKVRVKSTEKNIREIKDSLSRMAAGDFSTPINIKNKNTEYQEIIDAVNTVMQELQSVTILKGDFVKNFSHEFKTPIASIKGFSELLCKNRDLSEEEKYKYYCIIRDESARLSGLANTTLLLSKLDAQSIVINKEEIYIDEQIAECAMQLYGEVEKKNLDVQIDLEHFAVSASKELLKELWLNLFSNAVKYTNDNGRIKIFSYETTDEYAVCFQDTGIGISDDAIKHIFDEYYQEDNTRFHKGIGLGLAICKRICDLHNYQIKVVSTKGQGSAFTVLMPK